MKRVIISLFSLLVCGACYAETDYIALPKIAAISQAITDIRAGTTNDNTITQLNVTNPHGTLGGHAVVTVVFDTNVDVVASVLTKHTPDFAGQIIVGTASTNGRLWVAVGTTTNDWSKVN